MQDVLDRVAALNRPKLLVRAAKSAACDYRRVPHLARLLPGKATPAHSAAIHSLLDLERAQNDCRLRQGAEYCLTSHLDVLIALVAEVQLLSEHRKQRE